MVSKVTLGKIFVSYSWLDKQFVRRLVARLEKSGYLIWLDEKELAPGDRLSSNWGTSYIVFVKRKSKKK